MMEVGGFVQRKTKRVKLGQTTVNLFGDIKPIETAVAGRIFTEYSYEVALKMAATWSGGAPNCPNWGITQNFIERMRILIDSKQVVNISPVMAMTMANISKKALLESGSVVEDAAYHNLVKASNHRLIFDDTADKISANETIVINRAQPYCAFQEGVRTADDFRKYDNIQFYFDRKSIEQLLTDGNAPADFLVTDLQMTITVYAEQLLDLKSVDKVQLHSLELIESAQNWKAAATPEVVNLNRTAMLSNLYYKAFSGGAGLPADDETFDKVRLLKNGEDEIDLDTTHLDLQRAMLDAFEIYAPYESGLRFLDGVAMINNVRDSLSQAHDNTKLLNGEPTKTFQLELTTTAGADVTKPASVRVVQERLVKPL